MYKSKKPYFYGTGRRKSSVARVRVYENGKPINPLLIKSQPKKPISSANMQQYTAVRDSLIQRLSAL